MSQAVNATFVVEEREAPDLASEARNAGGQVVSEGPWDIPEDLIDDYGDANFEPFTCVLVAVSAAFLVKRLSDIWLDHTRPGGQVIDARGERLEIRHAPYIKPRGTFVILTPDGVETFPPEEREEALSMLEALSAAFGG
jgi:hypothetical protein